MKFYLILAASALLFSSCLKQSIPDAMLHVDPVPVPASVTATLKYEVNGQPLSITVADAGRQDPGVFTLGCKKYTGGYFLLGTGTSGQVASVFITDSLTAREYRVTLADGERSFVNYNNVEGFTHAPSDYMSVTVTAYDHGYISGFFSGQFTPLPIGTSTYGAASSLKITNGSFQNVPVFY